MESKLRGELFVLSAPSGTGKTSLIQSMMNGGLREFGEIAFSVSHTTRPPRQGEIPGSAYHFISHQEFQAMIAEDRFLEWAEVHANYYGTSYQEVIPRLDAGIDVIMDIDVQGAERVFARYEEVHSIFIMPPSFEDLQRRLESRNLDEAQQIAQRLTVSLWEIGRYDRYDYVIINDDLDRASDVLAAIILEKRHRLDRMREVTDKVLEGFQKPSPSD